MSSALQVLLIRHAKSSWDNPLLPDFERPLNERGRRDAKQMGAWLEKKNEVPKSIICSTAFRTKETISLLSKNISPLPTIYYEPNLYLAHADTFLKVLQKLKKSVHGNKVWLIGHNPGITDFANKMTPASIDNMSTCGVFGFEMKIKDWDETAYGKGKFLFFQKPKMFT